MKICFRKRYICRAIALTLALTAFLPYLNSVNAEKNAVNVKEYADVSKSNESFNLVEVPNYYDYINAHSDTEFPETAPITANFIAEASENVKVSALNGVEQAVQFTQNNATAVWSVEVQSAGFYAIRFSSIVLSEKSANAKYTVFINGKLLNKRMQGLTFPLIYVDEGEITQDSNGNDIRLTKIASEEWQTTYLFDPSYNDNGFMPVFLNEGKNTIEFSSEIKEVAIADVMVVQPESAVSYQDYRQSFENKSNDVKSGYYQQYEAELSAASSHSVLYPTYDRSDSYTSPIDVGHLKLNTIGQSSWNTPGQWIEWKISVPESGFYHLGMRVRQNEAVNNDSRRRVYIDGQVLFAELNQIKVSYDLNWQIKTLGEEKPFEIYLEKGEHTIRLEAIYGDLSQIITAVENVTTRLNDIYRQIIMITGTGTSVDSLRDYMLDEQIPGIGDELKSIKVLLNKQLDDLALRTEKDGGDATAIKQLIYQLDGFIANMETIPSQLETFRSNIAALSTWVLNLKKQPMELDYLYVKSPDVKDPKAHGNFFEKLWFRICTVVASFVSDYSTFSNEENAQVNVWVGLGRDQGQIILDLINSNFAQQYNMSVNLSIMQTGINEAIAAGRNPDILLFGTDAVNLASRGVLADISKYKTFEKIKSRFADSAMLPFQYKDGIYGLPLDQSVNLLFYRTDIFSELGLSVPETWDDFLDVLTVLQSNRLTAGITADPAIFELLVYQKGGRVLSEDLQTTEIDSEICYDAFLQFTQYYTKYSLLPDFNFFERFRSGEVAMGIQSQAMYSQLALGAPEIDGLWAMAPVPQMVTDGKKSNLTTGTYTQAYVFKNDNTELCLDFLDWFTSAETQVAYGYEIENILGIGARYTSANLEALEESNWSNSEKELLRSQMKAMTMTPVIPATYYVTRNLKNAFFRVYNSGYAPRESLLMYKDIIESEIARKNAELIKRENAEA